MAKQKQTRVKKKELLSNHVQTSLNDIEYLAIEPYVLSFGESLAVRKIIQYALQKGFLKNNNI